MLDQLGQLRRAWLRACSASRGLLAAKQPEHPAEFGHRLASGLLDRRSGGRACCGLAVEQVFGGTRLDDHDADAVGHDVVQFPGDPARSSAIAARIVSSRSASSCPGAVTGLDVTVVPLAQDPAGDERTVNGTR